MVARPPATRRRATLLALAGVVLALQGCGGGAATPAAPAPMPAASGTVVLGYFTGSPDSLASATAAGTPLNAISMDVLGVAADGSLVGAAPAGLVAADRAAGRASYACVANFGSANFDPALAHAALVTYRATTLQQLVALARTPDLAGINLDFEAIDPADRDAYTAFVAELAAQLHAIHATLVVSVPAKSADNRADSWTWPYDYAALGRAADLVQVMTYDEHDPGGAPGPVAGADWMQATLGYAVTQIPAAKILLGLPAYGYDWNLSAGGAASVALKDVAALLTASAASPQWDAATASGHFAYTAADGSAHQVWYETAPGLQQKTRLAVTLGLAGVSMWALGAEDPTFWAAVSAGLH